MTLFSDSILRQAVLGDSKSPFSVDDAKALLHQVMVVSIQYAGGKPIENTGTLPDMPFGDVWVNLSPQQKFDRVVRLDAIMFNMSQVMPSGNSYYPMIDALENAIEYSSAQVYIVRDVLYKRAGLPTLRKDMTAEQRKAADGIESQMFIDSMMRQKGRIRCIWTGIVTEITPEQKTKQKKVAHAKQKVLNALAVGAITVDEI